MPVVDPEEETREEEARLEAEDLKQRKKAARLKRLEVAVEALMRSDEFVVSTIEHAQGGLKKKTFVFAGWDTDESCMQMLEEILNENREMIRIIQGDPRAKKAKERSRAAGEK